MEEQKKKLNDIQKKIQKKIIIGLLAIFGPLFGAVFGLVIFIMIIDGPEALLPDVEDDVRSELQRVAVHCGISWEEFLACLTVIRDNDFEGIDPEVVALDFLLVSYDEYHVETRTETKEVSAVSLGVVGAKPDEMVEVDEDYDVWILDGTYFLEDPSSISNFASSTGCTETLATKIVDHLRALDATNEYDVRVSGKEMQDFMEFLTEDQQEWYSMLISENLIQEAFGTYYELPESIMVETSGYFAWPTPGITNLTSPYGWRSDPINGYQDFHSGLDIAEGGCEGKPVIAAAAGSVIDVQYKTTGYGYNVTIQHMDDDGNNWITRYCHLSQIVVDAGDGVERGTVVGAIGTTGRSTGAHLHFEIKYEGTTVDPLLLVEPQ